LRAPTAVPLLERNTPSLLNVGWNGLVSGVPANPILAPMFWDSRVQGLEQQVVHPIQSPAEMCGDGCLEGAAMTRAVERLQAITVYRTLFAEAFDLAAGPAVSRPHLTQAIATFERSLTTPGTPFDRYIEGETSALTPLAQRGLNVFQDAGCIQCHGGPMFSDFKLHFLGVPDSTSAGRREFRTPTLRNLRHAAPYLHNGGRRTVRDVLIFYDELAEAVSETLDGGDSSAYPPLDPLLKHLNLNAEDFPALEAFLDALNAEDYDQTVPGAVPSGLPVAR
jgi:cytochrome c peroxidase